MQALHVVRPHREAPRPATTSRASSSAGTTTSSGSTHDASQATRSLGTARGAEAPRPTSSGLHGLPGTTERSYRATTPGARAGPSSRTAVAVVTSRVTQLTAASSRPLVLGDRCGSSRMSRAPYPGPGTLAWAQPPDTPP